MTMLQVDGVPVIFEGSPRLRWPSAGRPGMGTPALALWPDRDAQIVVRLRLRTRGAIVVVFDGLDTGRRVSAASAPPPGDDLAVHADGSGLYRVTVRPLTWLPGPDRQRGLTFHARAQTGPRQWSARRGLVLTEDELIGTDEPLRFVYGVGPLALDQLRTTIARLFPAPERDGRRRVTSPAPARDRAQDSAA